MTDSLLLPLPSTPLRAIVPRGRTDITAAYADFITAAYPWQWFVTQTSRNRTHPEAMFKRFRYAVAVFERKHLGRRPVPRDRIVWTLAEERHKSGNPHLHAVMWSRLDLNTWTKTSRLEFKRILEDVSGFSKVEKPRSQQGVVEYCAKYLAKEGQINFSPTFGAHGEIRSS